MAKEKNRKGTAKKGAATKKALDVQLAPTIERLHTHLTESLCQEVFHDVRKTERHRKWSLFAMARFWLSVIVDPPPSLSDALERSRRRDREGFLPMVEASASAFFERAKNLKSEFFCQLYWRFVARVFPKAPRSYCRELAPLDRRFFQLLAIDGSRLDKIAHRLKILWDEKAAILPGCLLALYDLRRGLATQLWFEPDAAASEHDRALLALECLKKNTLLVGDRLYCSLAIFGLLRQKGSFGVFRRTKALSLKKVRKLGEFRHGDALLEDWIVTAGAGEEPLELRLIRLTVGGKCYEALTNVLDPKRLSAKEVATLYPLRWRVERLFHQLKVVLNLKRFYCANPNAVAQQVFAAALVHAAFRIAQADIAREVDLPPEDLSPAKLFPRLALASIKIIEWERMAEEFLKANRGKRLKKPSWSNKAETVVTLERILRQRRSPKRKPRPFDKERGTWKSITRIEGAED